MKNEIFSKIPESDEVAKARLSNWKKRFGSKIRRRRKGTRIESVSLKRLDERALKGNEIDQWEE